MVKYGLRPRTLKGELFTVLSKIGSCGLKVSELANSPQVQILNVSSILIQKLCTCILEIS